MASVYELINELCRNVIKDTCDNEKVLSLNRAKTIAFEIILKKNFELHHSRDELLHELEFVSFELQIANKIEDANQLNQLILDFHKFPLSCDSSFWLLIHLRRIEEHNQHKTNFFQIAHNLEPRNIRQNVYLRHHDAKIIQLPELTPSRNEDCTFLSGILDSYTTKRNKLHATKPKCVKTTDVFQTSTIENKKWRVTSKKAANWESLGEPEGTRVKVFSSESTASSLHRQLSSLNSPLEIKSISFVRLLNDIKLLMIGIETETFVRLPDDSLTFQMLPDITCDGMTNLSDILSDFLEMGTCYKRLKTFTSKNPFNQSFLFDGFIFKTFCDCIIRFLNRYRDIIYSQEAETILELLANTESMRKLVIHLTKFLRIHPETISYQALPVGSDFLRMLYNEYTKIIDNNEVKCFYVDLLKSCCEAYFTNFQKWIFNGMLDDPHKELFIYFVDHYRPNTKYFFDKAYLIRKSSVPTFLQGCAENILLCGKYTMLLKSHKPMHPLFMIHKPKLKVCLTNEEIESMRAENRKFVTEARKVCGKVITIEAIMMERHRVKMEKSRNAENASVLNAQRWRQEQEIKMLEIRQKQETQLQELRKNLQEIEDKRILKRMENLQAERDYYDEMDAVESERIEQENALLEKRVETYKKLNEAIDELNESHDKKLLKLHEQLNETVPPNTPNQDVLNANAPFYQETVQKVDDMNNVIAPPPQLTEAQRNRIKIMAHEYNVTTPGSDASNGNVEKANEKPLTEAQRNKLKVLHHEFETVRDELNGNEVSLEIEPVTDAQRNKMMILGHEFRIDDPKMPPKIKVQIEDDEATRNRKKILGSDIGSIMEISAPYKPNANSKNLTDLQRNRLKVMSHEFGLQEIPENDKPSIPTSLNLLCVEPANELALSPMSITSDHFTNDSEHQYETNESSPSDEIELEKCERDLDDEELEMLTAFEEAIERNRTNFMGINLNSTSLTLSSSSYDHIKTTDTMALSRYLQMSLTIPLNAYMEILNNETLKIFIEDLDILSHFKSLRNFFLLMNGEFSSIICHELFTKLESGVRPVELLNYQSLHMILDHALAGSSCHDLNTENLSFIVQQIPEKFEIHSPGVFNMLTLSYHLDWPLNLILNPETLEQYQAIFNYLLKLKRITLVLEECFQILKESHKRHGPVLMKSQQYRNVQQIRHKMTHFVHCLENHVTRNVLQISWFAFVDDLKTAKSIHCVYRKHTNYLKRILFLCLLNKKSFEFHKNIEELFKVILRFYKHLKSKDWHKDENSAHFSHSRYVKLAEVSDDFNRLIKYILYLGNKIVQHGYQKEIGDLLYLIDVNEHYSKS